MGEANLPNPDKPEPKGQS